MQVTVFRKGTLSRGVSLWGGGDGGFSGGESFPRKEMLTTGTGGTRDSRPTTISRKKKKKGLYVKKKGWSRKNTTTAKKVEPEFGE